MLRISGGRLKGRKIVFPNLSYVRPIKYRLRHNIFAFLADFIINAEVLDLFAGSGIFGFESISYGARYVTFVDKLDKTTSFIRKNIANLYQKKNAIVYKKDAMLFLINAKQKKIHFDIIFIDPPFSELLRMGLNTSREYVAELIDRAKDVLYPKSVIILKIHKKIDVILPNSMFVLKTVQMGFNKIYYILQKKYAIIVFIYCLA
jgi:16S rRNA (guanine966-N2)-methyltransferase